MKLIGAAFCVAAICAVGLSAQTSTTETKSKTKIEVKDGKNVTVNGCLERNATGGYIITTSRGDMKYALVTDDDLSKHIGHLIEVKGKAADRGDGKVKIESTVGTSGAGKTEAKTESTTELKGDAADMRYLGVKSVKMLSSSCM